MRKIKITTARTLAYATLLVSLATVGVVACNDGDDTSMYGPVSTPTATHTPVEQQTLDLPRCSEFEGRYDGTCWYDDATNDAVINFNHGEWTYDLDTGDMIHDIHAKG
jgi:hypothetical protein